ncbi:MAG: minor capsid protein [Cetobacterium sp.]
MEDKKNIKNSIYWKKRSLQIEEETTEKVEKMNKKIAVVLKESEAKVKKDIAELYGKFAVDNKLDIKESKKLLDGDEYRVWRKSLDEYIKEYRTTGNKELWKEIEVLTMRKRISRLESFNAQIKAETIKFGCMNDKIMSDGLTDVYKNSYNKNMYNSQVGNELLYSFSDVDADKIKDVLKWKNVGKNFSSRIYDSTTRIANRINKDMAQAFSTNISYDKISQSIRKDFKIAKFEADRLVRTEANFYLNQASLNSYKEAEIEKYIYEATLDRKTSSVCREEDQEIYDVDKAQVGTNYPPLHPNCRSTTVASFDVDYKNRIARDKNNVNILVDGKMKYEEWEKYHKNGEVPKNVVLKPVKKENMEEVEYAKKEFKEYEESFDELLELQKELDGRDFKKEFSDISQEKLVRSMKMKYILDILDRQKNGLELNFDELEYIKVVMEDGELEKLKKEYSDLTKKSEKIKEVAKKHGDSLKKVVEKQGIYNDKREKEIIKEKGLDSLEKMVEYSKKNNIKTINKPEEFKSYDESFFKGSFLKSKALKYKDSNEEKIQKMLIVANENKGFKKVYNKVKLDILVTGEFKVEKRNVGGYYQYYNGLKRHAMVLNTGYGNSEKKYNALYNFGRSHVGFDNQSTFMHEYGHRVDDYFEKKGIKLYDEWRGKVGKDFSIKKSVSAYGSNNKGEAIAELFSVTFSDTFLPEKFPPEFKIFKDLVLEKLDTTKGD